MEKYNVTANVPPRSGVALVAEMHPAYNFRGGTANLIKTFTSYPAHPFCAVVAADIAGPNPIPGLWDQIPTLSLFRPRSMLPGIKIGLGLLDNLAFKLQQNRVSRFLDQQKAERQFVMVANNPRFAIFAANLPTHIPKDVYIVDDFVADSRIYKISPKKARETLDRLITGSDRVFAISPIYAEDLQKQYGKPCYFLPLPVADSLLNSIRTSPRPFTSENAVNKEPGKIIIHHSGHIHHLYADALTELISIFKEAAGKNNLHIQLELWGRMTAKSVSKALKMDITPANLGKNFEIKLCGEVNPVELARQQQRADFLLLVNTFLPQYEKQVRCSFSSKICEYMVSGVPILLYAPPYSSLTAHLSKYNAAHIISNPDHSEASKQMEQILFDPARNKTVEPAQQLALNLHSSENFFLLFREKVGKKAKPFS